MAKQRIETALHVEEESGVLSCMCYKQGMSPLLSDYLYSVRLLMLSEEEFTLRSGRFLWFNRQSQVHRVSVAYRKIAKPLLVNPVIDWINDNVTGIWSMRGLPQDVSNFMLEFSFAVDSDAAMFALTWR